MKISVLPLLCTLKTKHMNSMNGVQYVIEPTHMCASRWLIKIVKGKFEEIPLRTPYQKKVWIAQPNVHCHASQRNQSMLAGTTYLSDRRDRCSSGILSEKPNFRTTKVFWILDFCMISRHAAYAVRAAGSSTYCLIGNTTMYSNGNVRWPEATITFFAAQCDLSFYVNFHIIGHTA